MRSVTLDALSVRRQIQRHYDLTMAERKADYERAMGVRKLNEAQLTDAKRRQAEERARMVSLLAVPRVCVWIHVGRRVHVAAAVPELTLSVIHCCGCPYFSSGLPSSAAICHAQLQKWAVGLIMTLIRLCYGFL